MGANNYNYVHPKPVEEVVEIKPFVIDVSHIPEEQLPALIEEVKADLAKLTPQPPVVVDETND